MVEEISYHGQFQDFVSGSFALWGVGSLGKECARTFGGITVRKISQERIRMVNQGAGSRWGISLRVVGGHHSLA